jgi:hypothetical protein
VNYLDFSINGVMFLTPILIAVILSGYTKNVTWVTSKGIYITGSISGVVGPLLDLRLLCTCTKSAMVFAIVMGVIFSLLFFTIYFATVFTLDKRKHNK